MQQDPAGRPSRTRLIVILVSVVVVVAGGLTAAVLLTRPSGNQAAQGTPTTTVLAPPTASTTAPPTAPATTSPVPRPTTTSPPANSFRYVPLWPFASQAEAVAWEEGFRSGGHQPWHLRAADTALSFTQGYLGYTNVDTVLRVDTAGREDWVTVGFANPNGQPVTSAVLHLARFGGDQDAPWEVVGSRDTTLTLTRPAYGSTVRSPVGVGGLITGVDESLRVQVRSLGRETALGRSAAVPAGGDRTPWRTTVSFTAVPKSVGAVTIAVATGGHIAAVERFAITGAYA